MGVAALTVDMSKAYDRMKWVFLKGMMLKLGFSTRLVDLIKLCVSMVKYNVACEGYLIGPIVPTRGLR